jgi:hypothetical protein
MCNKKSWHFHLFINHFLFWEFFSLLLILKYRLLISSCSTMLKNQKWSLHSGFHCHIFYPDATGHCFILFFYRIGLLLPTNVQEYVYLSFCVWHISLNIITSNFIHAAEKCQDSILSMTGWFSTVYILFIYPVILRVALHLIIYFSNFE